MTCIRIDLTFWSRSTLPSLQPIRHKDSTFIDKHSFALNRFAVYNVYNFFLSKTLLPNKVRFGELLCCPSNRFARKSQFYCFFRACNIARYIGTVDRIIEPGFSTWSIQPVELSIKQSILFSKFNDDKMWPESLIIFLILLFYSLVFNHVEGVIVQRWIRSFGIVRKSLVLNLRKYAGTSS